MRVMFSTARSASSVSASRHLGQAERPRGRDPMEAGDQLEPVPVAADDDRDEHALQRDRSGERFDVRLVERAHVLGHADLLERDLAPGVLDGCGHVVLLDLGPAPLAGRSPAARTPARACHPRVAGRPAGAGGVR